MGKKKGENGNGAASEADRTKVIGKLQKLLALSKSPVQAEAELAMEKASELMTRHEISMAEVTLASIEAGEDGIVEVEYRINGLNQKLHYPATIANACARLFGGTALTYGWDTSQTRIAWVGRKTQIEAAKELFEYLWGSWQEMVKRDVGLARKAAEQEALERYGMKVQGIWNPQETLRFKQGHGVAFASVVWWRCESLRRSRDKAMEEANENSKALVVVDRQRVDKWLKEKGVRTTSVVQSDGDRMGREMGRVAGESVRISKELSE